MAPFGVKVLCIEPGFFKTNVTDTVLVKKSLTNLWNRLPPDVKDSYGHDFLERGDLQHLFVNKTEIHMSYHVIIHCYTLRQS